MNEKKKQGRPPKYSDQQVLMAIDMVEAEGSVPNGDSVKAKLCGNLGISHGINAQSLEDEVRRQLELRQEKRDEALIAMLPASAKTAALKLGKQFEVGLVKFLATEFDGLRSNAAEKLREKDADLRIHRDRDRENAKRLGEKEERIAALERDVHDLSSQVADRENEIVDLKDQIQGFKREEEFEAKMLKIMKQRFGSEPLTG